MKVPALALVAALGVSACTTSRPEPESNILPGKIQATTGPYVSVAVDNHFHDVHPRDDIEVAYERDLVVRNEGRNLHNVTFSGTDIDEDIRPGEEFRIRNVGRTLGEGLQRFVCRYHVDQNMLGEFIVLPPEGG